MIEKFISLIRDLGHFPVSGEVRMREQSDAAFPSHNSFSRFGSKQKFAARIVRYCEDRGGCDDVLNLCTPIATLTQVVQSDGKDDPTENIGFVYLMKSGRYYKIGRSNAAGRREYELRIQMPEKLSTVHTIRTDDPVGIEIYWHRRFADKRKNGEWFDLSGLDVKAFKRRKFM